MSDWEISKMREQFIEVNADARKVLINVDEILLVHEESAQVKACIILRGTDVRINCTETYQEIRKRLGLAISPRAETIMKP